MRNHKNKLLIFIIILLVANTVFSAVLWLKINYHPKPELPRQRSHYLLEELHPDSAQKTQLLKLISDHFIVLDSLKDKEHNAKNAFFSLLLTDTASASTILNFAEHASNIQFEIDTMVYQHFNKMRSMCNPEQKERLDKVIQRILIQSDDANKNDEPAPFKSDNFQEHKREEKSLNKQIDDENHHREEMRPDSRRNHRMPPPPPNDRNRRPHERHPDDFPDGPPPPPPGMEK